MKKSILLVITAFAFLFSCKKEKIKECTPFSGGIIEAIMIENGGSAIANALNQTLTTGGHVIRISCGGQIGQYDPRFAIAYTDRLHSYAGKLELDNVEIVKLDGGVQGQFALPTEQGPILNLFGQSRQFKQYNCLTNNIMHQTAINLPALFRAEGNTIAISSNNSGHLVTWPPGINTDSLYLLVYSKPSLSTDSVVVSTFPVVKVKKIADNGSFSISSQYLSNIPSNCPYIVQLIRTNHVLYNDSEVAARKNLIFSAVSALKFFVKE